MTDKTNFPAGRCDKPNFHNRAPVGESMTPKQSGTRDTRTNGTHKWMQHKESCPKRKGKKRGE